MRPCPKRRSLQANEGSQASEAVRCWSASLRILGRSDKTVSTLRSKLIQRDFSEEVVEATLQRLLQSNFIDDARFAEAYVRAKSASVGRRQLERKLNEQGVAVEVIQVALAPLDEQSQLQVAKELAERRYRAVAHLQAEVAERRLTSFLQRRGFSGSDVWQAVRHVIRSR